MGTPEILILFILVVFPILIRIDFVRDVLILNSINEKKSLSDIHFNNSFYLIGIPIIGYIWVLINAGKLDKLLYDFSLVSSPNQKPKTMYTSIATLIFFSGLFSILGTLSGDTSAFFVLGSLLQIWRIILGYSLSKDVRNKIKEFQ